MLARTRVSAWSSRKRVYSSFGPARRRLVEDEADWIYSGEWWGSQDGGFGRDEGQTVFRKQSFKGNGLVSVTAHPASIPTIEDWPGIEKQLQQKYKRLLGGLGACGRVRILGFQWRVLRFNSMTRESVAKVMSVYIDTDPSCLFLMQQPHCLAFPYVKSMVSIGLTALASTNFDLKSAVSGKQKMRILCIGNGGGTIPLFLASKIKGAHVDVVEIDEAVISASIKSMGFPAVLKMGTRVQEYYSEDNSSGFHVNESSQIMHKVFWDGIQERVFLNEADGEAYICDSPIHGRPNEKGSLWYDMVFIDAYDGDDIFPYKFRDRNGPFLSALCSKLHPRHGTVIVNLHADSPHPPLQESLNGNYDPGLNPVLPLGRQTLEVARLYRDALQGTCSREAEEQDESMLAFTVTVPCLANVTLAITRGFSSVGISQYRRDVFKEIETSRCFSEGLVLEKLFSDSQRVHELFNLPFDCSQYVRRGFFIVR